MCASRLSRVRTRGELMIRRVPTSSRAEADVQVDVVRQAPEGHADRAARPAADGRRQVDREVRVRHGPGDGRQTRRLRVDVRRAAGDADRRREGEAGRVAGRRPAREVTAPLDAQLALVRARRLDDPRLDEDLRGLGVEVSDELLDLVEVVADVAGDQGVGALVDRQRAAGRQQLVGPGLELRGRRVADGDEARLERLELHLLLAPRDGHLALLLEALERSHADQVAGPHHAEALRLQDHLEGLVPGHVPHADRDGPGDLVARDDVDAPDVGHQPQDVVDVRVLEVEIDATPRESAPSRAAVVTQLHGHGRQEAAGLLLGELVGDGALAGDGPRGDVRLRGARRTRLGCAGCITGPDGPRGGRRHLGGARRSLVLGAERPHEPPVLDAHVARAAAVELRLDGHVPVRAVDPVRADLADDASEGLDVEGPLQELREVGPVQQEHVRLAAAPDLVGNRASGSIDLLGTAGLNRTSTRVRAPTPWPPAGLRRRGRRCRTGVGDRLAQQSLRAQPHGLASDPRRHLGGAASAVRALRPGPRRLLATGGGGGASRRPAPPRLALTGGLRGSAWRDRPHLLELGLQATVLGLDAGELGGALGGPPRLLPGSRDLAGLPLGGALQGEQLRREALPLVARGLEGGRHARELLAAPLGFGLAALGTLLGLAGNRGEPLGSGTLRAGPPVRLLGGATLRLRGLVGALGLGLPPRLFGAARPGRSRSRSSACWASARACASACRRAASARCTAWALALTRAAASCASARACEL
jgi:hypothetical protein